MVQGLGYAAISLAARRRHSPRLSRRVRRPNRARLSTAQRRSRAVAVSAPVHRGDAIDRRRGINDIMRRSAAREAAVSENYFAPGPLLFTRTLVAIGPVSPTSSL